MPWNPVQKHQLDGNSLAVQWLGLGTLAAMAQVQSLVGELISCKLCNTATPKKKKNKPTSWKSVYTICEGDPLTNLKASSRETLEPDGTLSGSGDTGGHHLWSHFTLLMPVLVGATLELSLSPASAVPLRTPPTLLLQLCATAGPVRAPPTPAPQQVGICNPHRRCLLNSQLWWQGVDCISRSHRTSRTQSHFFKTGTGSQFA